MVITIAFHDRPGEVLYSFSKVGDSVCIGRDERKCKIALGVNAEGVSRVHLKLELLSNGRLLVQDTSTYGTGYDGGPLERKTEKELKPSLVLQVGSFFFIIEEKNVKRNCREEAIAFPSPKIAKINSRKRLSLNKAVVVVEEECVSKRSKWVNAAVRKLTPEMDDSERKVKSTETGLITDAGSSFSVADVWVQEQEQDRKLVARLGKKLEEKMDSSKQTSSKSVNEISSVDKNNTPISHIGRLNFLESQNVVSEQKKIATGLTSWLNMNAAKKRCNQFGNQSNTDEMLVFSKRMKMGVVEDENEKQKSEKNEMSIGNGKDCEVNDGENDQILGIDLEILRMKLKKTVQYEDLERPISTEDRSQSELTGHFQGTNYKRFTKAAQGSHVGCGLLHSVMSPIVTDFIDFREIA